MARLPRSLIVFAGHSVHKVWRGHNREWNLGTDEEKRAYLDFLNDDFESGKYKVGAELQALTLMSNHTHELFWIEDRALFSNHMRRHHSRYGAFFNRLRERCGKVAQDRAHTTLLENDVHEMETLFYVHANPVRAKMVGDARNYHWSTHKLYAFGIREPWMRNVRLPQCYMKLGKTPELRQRAYRKLFARYLKEKGFTRQTFLNRPFFGSPVWVQQHEEALATWREQRAAPS